MFGEMIPAFHDVVHDAAPVDLGARHGRLAEDYAANPTHAMVIDEAETSSAMVPAGTSLYLQVTPGHYGTAPIDMGVHEKVGGNHDFPNPGELLCAAIAACFDSCVRLITCRLGISLNKLTVNVKGNVDVRGTLKLNSDVPVGFQGFTVDVQVECEDDVPEQTIAVILKAAEESCVVMQTIRQSPPLEVKFRIND